MALIDLEMCITSVERVEEYINLPSQAESPTASVETISRGAIRFDKVAARYSPEAPLALSGINLAIKPGQRVGICGRSGSGKSTLLGALWRLISLESGTVHVDGMDISEISLLAYRDAMSIVPQGKGS